MSHARNGQPLLFDVADLPEFIPAKIIQLTLWRRAKELAEATWPPIEVGDMYHHLVRSLDTLEDGIPY